MMQKIYEVRPPTYSVIIRAHQMTDLLEKVVANVNTQTLPPNEIIIVDSSNCVDTRKRFSEIGAKVVIYDEKEFNYSKAINVGVAAVSSPYTLILSSHLLIENNDIIKLAYDELMERNLEVVYWCLPRQESCPHEFVEVGKSNFNGRNGISNSMSLIPTPLLRDRPFREEIFSAEDQEWTKYYFNNFKRNILRVHSADIRYLNPQHGASVWSELKLFNEELAIGHFVNRRLIMPDRILMRFLRGVLAIIRLRPERAKMHFSFAAAMLMANFRRPQRQSRYF